MEIISSQTLASIVSANHQAAPVLEKYHLDFCCKGKRTLAQACSERGVDIEKVLNEIEQVAKVEVAAIPFSEMNASQLINYIIAHHHFYVIHSMPVILEHLEKVASKHGERYPEMKKVLQLFSKVEVDMTLHMKKEEKILFLRIVEIEMMNKKQQQNTDKNYINNPVHVMESEHDEAGDVLNKIRELTNNYLPPTDACTTFKVALKELKSFEEDLHKHVHLENNILFPLAKIYLT